MTSAVRVLLPLVFLSVPALTVRAQSAPPGVRPVTDRAQLGAFFLPARPGQSVEGVRLAYIYPGSAASALGLKPGDEVLELNGLEVPDRRFLSAELRREQIGSRVRIKVRRGAEVLELSGRLGSYLETRKAFLDHCRRELVGKPFAPVAELVWPEGVDALKGSRGKVLVLVSFDGCQECMEGRWRKIREMEEALRRAGAAQDWLAFSGIYSDVSEGYEKNKEARRALLARYPSRFPVALARYPGDQVPLDSTGREPLVQEHGVAILDPEGKLLYLDLERPAAGFVKAFAEAQEKFGPKKDAAPPSGAPPAGR